MSTAGFDEGIGNLERLIALVTETCNRLEESERGFGALGASLDSLEQGGGSRLEAFGDHLEKHRAELESARTGAAEAVEELSALASAAADSDLTDAANAIDEIGDLLDDSFDAREQKLDDSLADLVGSGFDAAVSTATSLATDVAGLQREVEEAFGVLEAGVDVAEGDVQAAESDLSEAFSNLGAEAEAKGASLSDVGELARYVSSEYLPDLQATGGVLEQDIEEAYVEFGIDGEEAVKAMVASVSDLLHDTADHLELDTAAPLTDGLEKTLDGSVPSLLAELSEVEGVLSAGTAVTDAAAALVPELCKADAVVGEIDRLLDAMSAA